MNTHDVAQVQHVDHSGPAGHTGRADHAQPAHRRRNGRLITAGSLLGVAIGLGVLWAAGQPFPFYPPPGMIIATLGLIIVLGWRRRFVPLLGTGLGVFYLVGFALNAVSGGDGGLNLTGAEGIGRLVGQILQLLGSVFAVGAGIWAVRSTRRRR